MSCIVTLGELNTVSDLVGLGADDIPISVRSSGGSLYRNMVVRINGMPYAPSLELLIVPE